MNTLSTILFVLCLVQYCAYAADSVKVYHSKPVQVNGTADNAKGITIEHTEHSTSVVTVSRSSPIISTAFQTSDAITYMPGVFVRNYGGLGGLKTVSVFGITPQQTVIKLDGVSLNNTQNGFFDISLLPSGMIENMKLQSGGLSSVSGSGAVGGVLDISTHTLYSDTAQYHVSGTIGSFAETNVHTGVTLPCSSLALRADAQYQHTNGNYPFVFNQFGQNAELTRTNADFTSYSGWLGVNYTGLHHTTTANVLYRNAERGAPGAVLQGDIENAVARLSERDVLAIISTKVDVNSTLQLKSQGSFKYNKQHYRDSLLVFRGPNGADDTYNAQDAMVNCAVEQRFDEVCTNTQVVLAGTANITQSQLEGNLLTSNAGTMVKRNVYALGLVSTLRTLLNTTSFLSVSTGARQEWYSDVPNAVSPFVALLYGVTRNLSIDALYSYNYRAPSFNELYYQNYGTFNLKPERSSSYTLGFHYSVVNDSSDTFLNTISIKPQLFFINTTNQIISVPKTAVAWSAQNAAQVNSRGVSLFVIGNLLNNHLSCVTSYTYQIVTDVDPTSLHYQKEMIYTPNHLASVFLTGTVGAVQVGGGIAISGSRYTQPDNAIESQLDFNAPVSMFVTYTAQLYNAVCKFRVECNNMFNQQYEVIRNFPMPGRILRVTSDVTL